MLRARSLRTRLVALTLLLLAVASIVVGLVTALAVRQSLVSRLDPELFTVSSGPGLLGQGRGRPSNGGNNPASGGSYGSNPGAGGPPPPPHLIAVGVPGGPGVDYPVHN